MRGAREITDVTRLSDVRRRAREAEQEADVAGAADRILVEISDLSVRLREIERTLAHREGQELDARVKALEAAVVSSSLQLSGWQGKAAGAAMIFAVGMAVAGLIAKLL